MLCEEPSRNLTCTSFAFFSLFLRQPITFFLKSICCLLASFTSFSLPKFKHAGACTASFPTKCSSMLCHFSSHLPGMLFAYALSSLFMPFPLLRKPKHGFLLCCFLYCYYFFQASFASYSLPVFSLHSKITPHHTFVKCSTEADSPVLQIFIAGFGTKNFSCSCL